MLHQELVQSVCCHAGLGCEDFGSCGGGCDTKHRAVIDLDVEGGSSKGSGLASSGRTNDEFQVTTLSRGCGDFDLAGIEPFGEDHAAILVTGLAESLFCPGEEMVFLVEDRLGGEGPVDGWFGDRPPVPTSRNTCRHWPGDVHAPGIDSKVGEPLKPRGQLASVSRNSGRCRCSEFAEEFGRTPRRLTLLKTRHCRVDHPPGAVDVDTAEIPLPADSPSDDLIGVKPQILCSLPPFLTLLLGGGSVWFGRSTVSDRFAFQLPPFLWCRVAV